MRLAWFTLHVLESESVSMQPIPRADLALAKELSYRRTRPRIISMESPGAAVDSVLPTLYGRTHIGRPALWGSPGAPLGFVFDVAFQLQSAKA